MTLISRPTSSSLHCFPCFVRDTWHHARLHFVDKLAAMTVPVTLRLAPRWLSRTLLERGWLCRRCCTTAIAAARLPHADNRVYHVRGASVAQMTTLLSSRLRHAVPSAGLSRLLPDRLFLVRLPAVVKAADRAHFALFSASPGEIFTALRQNRVRRRDVARESCPAVGLTSCRKASVHVTEVGAAGFVVTMPCRRSTLVGFRTLRSPYAPVTYLHPSAASASHLVARAVMLPRHLLLTTLNTAPTGCP